MTRHQQRTIRLAPDLTLIYQAEAASLGMSVPALIAADIKRYRRMADAAIPPLTERQWKVIEVEDGAQALIAFEQHQPDVVVLDALMPGLDGFATCERLRRLPGGDHVPVLMLTGLDDDNSVARAYEAGATDFFVKTNAQWTLLSQRLRYILRAARMREELAASEAKLSKAQRIARLGSWEWDPEARRVRLSDECFSIAGLTPQGEALADWFVWSRVHEEERPRILTLYAEAVRNGSPLHLWGELFKSRTGAPMALNTAQAIAPAVGITGGSPSERTPVWPFSHRIG